MTYTSLFETLFADPKNIGFAKGTWFAPFNFPDVFHVIALLWDTDDTVTTLVDGKPFVKRKYK